MVKDHYNKEDKVLVLGLTLRVILMTPYCSLPYEPHIERDLQSYEGRSWYDGVERQKGLIKMAEDHVAKEDKVLLLGLG